MTYQFYKFVHYLVTKKNYQIITIHREKEEIWMRSKKNRFQLIRIIHKDFVWDNDWKDNIKESLYKGEQLRTYFGLEECELVHIVFTPHKIYEEWNAWNNISYENLDILKMRTIAIEEVDLENDYEELSKVLRFNINEEMKEYDDEKPLETLFAEINEANTQLKKKNRNSLFVPFHQPYMTYILLAIQLSMFLLLQLNGGSKNPITLVEFGAKYNPLIDAGEWWRLITPIFLHIGFLHLAMNSYSLFLVGQEVERIYGRIRFLLIYLFSGFTGCLVSYLTNESLSAGASGAIFGCLGALLYVSQKGAKGYKKIFSSPIMIIIIINLIFGLTTPGIDNAGHLGGLVGGVIISGALRISTKRDKKSWGKGVYYLLIIAILFFTVRLFIS